MALRLKRRFVGIELKEEYYKEAIKNLRVAEKLGQQELFKKVDNDS